jgi:sporulation protein YabP
MTWEGNLVDEKRKPSDVEVIHHISINNRQQINIDGVKSVESFDDQEIVIDTTSGGLILKGQDLNITQLNLDQGKLMIEGMIRALDYLDDGIGKKGMGVFGKIFK